MEVVSKIYDADEFTSAQIKSACAEEQPGFVTRIINQMDSEGILKKDETSKVKTFRWKQSREQFSVEQWVERQITGTQITQSKVSDRPRERLLKLGADKMRTAELFAILIRTGRKGESAVQAGEKLANAFAEKIEQLPQAARSDLKAISPVVYDTAYCQIMAGIELGRRVAAACDNPNAAFKITGSSTAIEFCRRHFSRLALDRRQEEFHIVTLDTKHKVIDTHQITVGTLDASLVHPREVFRPAIRDAASAIILVHNHPSGDPTPSREDIKVTEHLKRAADLIEIRVLDHIIVAKDESLSIEEYQAA